MENKNFGKSRPKKIEGLIINDKLFKIFLKIKEQIGGYINLLRSREEQILRCLETVKEPLEMIEPLAFRLMKMILSVTIE
jgi:hypothetical protein